MTTDSSVSEHATDRPAEPHPPARTAVMWLDVLKVVAIPLVSLVLGFVFNNSINSRQTRDNNVRLYTEMMGRREEADSALRKDMFNLILGTFMSKDPKLTPDLQLDQEVLSLELLAYNFHESLDVGPLFKHVRQRIERAKKTDERTEERAPRYDSMLKRLQDVTLAVVERQLALLSDTGVVARGDLVIRTDTSDAALAQEATHPVRSTNMSLITTTDFGNYAVTDGDPDPSAPDAGISRVCLRLESTDGEGHYRQFGLQVIAHDRASRELYVALFVTRVLDKTECLRSDLDQRTTRENQAEFWLGSFDLPMIDNVHLTHGERAAVSLIRLTEGPLTGNDLIDSARLAISYFPGSRASLKEKPYYDDLVHDLIRNERLADEGRH